jgi:hypothetical protein
MKVVVILSSVAFLAAGFGSAADHYDFETVSSYCVSSTHHRFSSSAEGRNLGAIPLTTIPLLFPAERRKWTS